MNVFVFALKNTVDVTSLPELARRGFLKYSNSGNVTCSTCSPLVPLTKSKSDIVTMLDGGSTTTLLMKGHP